MQLPSDPGAPRQQAEMRTVIVTARMPNCSADRAYATLCDFARYPEVAEAVRQVSVQRGDDGSVTSTWEVDFRDGVMEWTERDEFDEDATTIRFTQLDGDFDELAGAWSARTDGEDALIEFKASFDVGIPSLGAIIEPLAERTLHENVEQILRGLLGDDLELLPAGAGPRSS
jgi:ribosome-associated toxin RatA of RatAB toxin-antitoxin module